MRFVGVDPGLEGGIALLSPDAARVVTWAMPIVTERTGAKGRPRRSVDLRELARIVEMILTDYDDSTVVTIEDVQASPQMGRTSAFNFGAAAMAVEAIFAFQAFHSNPNDERVIVRKARPAVWKVKMQVTADKEECVQKAARLWPRNAKEFYGPRGGNRDGRAEAALVAEYGRLIWETQQRRSR